MGGLRRICRCALVPGFGRNRFVCAVLFVHDLWPWTYFDRCLHPPQCGVQRCLSRFIWSARFHQSGQIFFGPLGREGSAKQMVQKVACRVKRVVARAQHGTDLHVKIGVMLG